MHVISQNMHSIALDLKINYIQVSHFFHEMILIFSTNNIRQQNTEVDRRDTEGEWGREDGGEEGGREEGGKREGGRN